MDNGEYIGNENDLQMLADCERRHNGVI